MPKLFASAASALDGQVRDGMTVMSGGFGLCGIAEHLIEALRASGVTGLTVISNNAGVDGFGLGTLLEGRQIAKMIASYVGENKLFEQMYLNGELQVEFNPQGTLAGRESELEEREFLHSLRARVSGTVVAADFADSKNSDGREHLWMERALKADIALIKAWKSDHEGNLIYRKTAHNVNPIMASTAC